MKEYGKHSGWRYTPHQKQGSITSKWWWTYSWDEWVQLSTCVSAVDCANSLSGCLCQIRCFLKDVLLKCANLKLVHTQVNFRSNSEIGWMLDQYEVSLERNAYSFHHGGCLELTEKGGSKRQIDSCLFCYWFSTFCRQCSPSLPAWKGSERESWGGLLALPHLGMSLRSF